jgi:hypothetical protein
MMLLVAKGIALGEEWAVAVKDVAFADEHRPRRRCCSRPVAREVTRTECIAKTFPFFSFKLDVNYRKLFVFPCLSNEERYNYQANDLNARASRGPSFLLDS